MSCGAEQDSGMGRGVERREGSGAGVPRVHAGATDVRRAGPVRSACTQAATAVRCYCISMMACSASFANSRMLPVGPTPASADSSSVAATTFRAWALFCSGGEQRRITLLKKGDTAEATSLFQRPWLSVIHLSPNPG